MIEDGAFSYKTHYVVIFFLEILSLKVHLNCITGSRVTAILLKGLILSIVGWASAVEGLLSIGPTPSSFDTKQYKNVRICWGVVEQFRAVSFILDFFKPFII